MKRVVKFSGLNYGDPTVELNIWLNRHPKSKLVNIHTVNSKYSGVNIIALVDVPEGTKIYQAEIDYEENEEEKS